MGGDSVKFVKYIPHHTFIINVIHNLIYFHSQSYPFHENYNRNVLFEVGNEIYDQNLNTHPYIVHNL